MASRHDTTVLGASVLIGLAVLLMVAVGASEIGSAADRPASTVPGASYGVSPSRQLEALPQGPSASDDPTELALDGLAELQVARETADPAHYARAQAAFEAAVSIEPDNVEALIGQGTLALARHHFAEALSIGERALAVDVTQARALGVIADAQVELGRYDDALASVQHMVDMRPDLASYSRVSYLRELHGDITGAIEAMELAVEAGGPSVENTEYVRVQLGHLHLANGDAAAAESSFEAALDELPDYVHATAGLARVRLAEGRLAEAIDLLEGAAARTPLPEFVIALGEAYEAAGRRSEADDQYALAEAMVALQEANGVEVDLDLAAFVADHGDPAQAVELARSAYDRAPSIRAAAALAWSLFAAGETEEAATYADEALRTGWSDLKVLVHAGLIARAAGMENLARERLETARELNPSLSLVYAPVAAEALAALGVTN